MLFYNFCFKLFSFFNERSFLLNSLLLVVLSKLPHALLNIYRQRGILECTGTSQLFWHLKVEIPGLIASKQGTNAIRTKDKP